MPARIAHREDHGVRTLGPGFHLLQRSFLPFSMIALAACLLATSRPTTGQQPEKPSQPYAAINREAIDYRGPGREPVHDLAGPEIRIGLLVPLRGPRKAEGEALLAAAQIAMEEESAQPLPHGRRLMLVWRDESGLWGRTSSEIVNLVFEDQAVALVTSADGAAAHLAEQVGNRIGVPVLTLASDSTTTQINIPWFFRMPPNDAAQARAFAEDIYRQRGFTRVALVTESHHDGRVGGEEFEKAARQIGAAQPQRVLVSLPLRDVQPLVEQIRAGNPQAIVLWTGPETAARLVPALEDTKIARYLCQKAAQVPFAGQAGEGARHALPLLVAVTGPSGADGHRQSFENQYRARRGTPPSVAAAAAYDAVRLIAAALHQSGPNRARVRDTLAKTKDFRGASGTICFDGAGNNQAAVRLVPLE